MPECRFEAYWLFTVIIDLQTMTSRTAAAAYILGQQFTYPSCQYIQTNFTFFKNHSCNWAYR